MNEISRNQIPPYNRGSDRTSRNERALKEGVLVNNLIRPECKEDWFIISQNQPLPVDLYAKKGKISSEFIKNPLLLATTAPVAILGGIALISKLAAKTITQKIDKTIEKLPDIGRNINLDKELVFNVYNYFLNPTPKKLLVGGVVALGIGVEYVAKNIVDGVKDVWVQKQQADIKRDLEESLIEVETRNFAGKNQILRALLSDTSKQIKELKQPTSKREDVDFEGFDKGIYAPFTTKINFEKNTDKNKNSLSKNLLYLTVGTSALVAAGLFGRSILKNLRNIAKSIEEGTSKINPEQLNDLKAINKKEKIYVEMPDANGVDVGKNGFNAYVNHVSAFLYSYLINPTPQTAGLMLGVYGATAASYVGAKTVEAIKDVQVKKSNAKTELELQDRLVQVELKNFLAKKKSYIEPMISELKQKKKNGASTQEISAISENIIYEVKNGPPFIYS